MDYLAKSLRRKLEKAVIKARDVAEAAARSVLEHLGVGETEAPKHLSEEQRALRRRLRAHGRQLGDHRRPDGHQSIGHLVQETAYEHWHRMLFARFLAENHLLMHPDGVPLTLNECDELAADEGATNGWELAGRYASRMLPQIFRPDSSVLKLTLAPEHQRALERLLAGLDPETFLAQDSLGWVYQFWQSKKKDEVNRSEVKIGAEELPAVTQLFTEPYMVSFLLDNSLGAWWVANHPDKPRPVPLEYLRTLEDGTPAAGRFEAWPKHLGELKVMDPCCGSGHFLVAALLVLVPMRMELEELTAQEAVDRVLTENIHGLELDQRCVELAAFALALTAWRYPDAGGYRGLPEFHIACSGLGIHSIKADWLKLAHGNRDMENALERLYDVFKEAPILGSLVNPKRVLKSDLFAEDWKEISHVVSLALLADNADEVELGVVAKGLTEAATLLSNCYNLTITNVPYLGREGHCEALRRYGDRIAPWASYDLATLFVERLIEFQDDNGFVCVVLPQNWWVGKNYEDFRNRILKITTWKLAVILGEEAWQAFGNRGPNTVLVCFEKNNGNNDSHFSAIDVSTKPRKSVVKREIKEKALAGLVEYDGEELGSISTVSQNDQFNNPASRISFSPLKKGRRLRDFVDSGEGSSTGDADRFLRFFWEVSWGGVWERYCTPDGSSEPFGGRQQVMFWEKGNGDLANNPQARIQNTELWNRKGILVGRVRGITSTYFDGGAFSKGGVLICPRKEGELGKIYCFVKSHAYEMAIRELDPRVSASTSVLTNINFDVADFSDEEIPVAFGTHPNQWVFMGHLTPSESALQVCVARLLGYRWPAETDATMELSDESRVWIDRCKDLISFVDDDGIVCIPSIRGEKPAAERLLSLLQAAYDDDWSAHKLKQLLEEAKAKGKGIDWWVREKFFEQHCKLFQHRPFIWHIWDGLKDGFAALVNYHKLDHKTLETLIYTYLGDWIGLQERAVSDGVDGAELRLTAARELKKRLELILEGEAPYDIFVRWKPLEEQPIGWNPDLNDGVRLNIRPFMTAEVLRHNKKPKLNIHWNNSVIPSFYSQKFIARRTVP